MSNILLDTNAVIAMQKQEPAVLSIIQSQTTYLSTIVVGELLFGAEKSGRPEENKATVNRLTQQYPVLTLNLDTARLYGQIFAQLIKQGRPIPHNDLWIAALALQYGLTVLMQDKHLLSNPIPQLQVQTW